MTILIVVKKLSIAELKTHAPRVIRLVEAGESCIVTRRNEPVARLEPLAKAENRTVIGFDPKVVIRGDVTGPVLEKQEWGDLYPE